KEKNKEFKQEKKGESARSAETKMKNGIIKNRQNGNLKKNN
ncbi:15258_t:CDS:1, partial [Cetraspora pellucida]